ncbi:MAG TPA: DUF58 domain-containing protein [Micromonosporaceae bacterium]|nr:DUF58 domain-containing protein [Micromonosporaceae bacterium]
MRISTRGYGLLVAGVLLLAAGFAFGYPELAALGSAAVVALAGAVAFVAWKPQLTVDRVADPDRVTRGEPSVVTLGIVNASRLFGATLVARDRVRPGRPPRPDGAGQATAADVSAVPVPLVRLRAGATTGVTYPVPTRRRGVIEVGPLEVSRRDPLGLVSAVRTYGDATAVWVRPRTHTIAAVPVGLSRSMDGRVDRVPHGSITFAALREYVVGDDLRHVHWRTSARVGQLMVREHVDTSLPRVVVLLDDRMSAHAPGANDESTFEAACEAAASVLVAAYREDVHAELYLVSGAAAAVRRGAVGPVLDLLAEADLTMDADLSTAAERLRVRRVGDTLVYLTGPRNDDDLGVVAGLRGAYPSIIAGTFASVPDAEQSGSKTAESGLATISGLLVVGASDGAEFAAAWDGVRAW